jgi:hypothetical protein
MQKKSDLTQSEKMEVPTMNKTSKGIDIISGEIVEKAIIHLNGEIDKNQKEYYIRCSVQDYFIKFCESELSKELLLKYFDPNKLINPITFKGKIVHGLLDSCPDKPNAESRTGYYVQISSLVVSIKHDLSSFTLVIFRFISKVFVLKFAIIK